MECTLLSCILFAISLSIIAGPVVSSPQENISKPDDPAALFNSEKPAKVGTWLLLKDYMDQGDSLLKERLKSSHSNLKELFSDRYSDLKEQLQEGDTDLKEQQKDGDERLNEELDEDVAWLKDKLAKGQTRMKEEIAEAEAQMKEELSEQKEAFEELKHSSASAVVDDLKQQMLAFQAELKSTKEELQRTSQQLQKEVQAFAALKTQLQTAEGEIHTLKLKHNSSQSSQVHDLLQTPQQNFHCAVGSTFVRWGHSSCPANTSSLVYSGVAGGSWYGHTGGAANYLCLVMDPQLETMSRPNYVNFVYGAEYDMVDEHDQDVVCSVCWAPQSANLMVPATTVCPSGWQIQYKGYLMSASKHLEARTEYVCVDGAREARHGGSENKDGALFYPVFAACGSLPCPPYNDDNKVVTCVVCSM